MKEEILIAGFGGQGILLMGRILAEAAMYDGYHATWFPSYGPEMRGGTANCITILSDDEIGSPIVNTYDIAVVMNQPSLERFGPKVRPGGLVLVNSSMVPVRFNRTDVEVAYVPAAAIAKAAGIERGQNIVMLGALLGARCPLTMERVENAIRENIGRKHPEAVDRNLAALHAGREAVSAPAAA
ncbi:Pyruvate synthase subunit PorC [Phycisphaerae bacterium RAS1]|nr:Pyruvate synthase subunit PorC [Phycisphaerae bacterium RAS1]